MGLSHNWDTPEEQRAHLIAIETKTGEEEQKLVERYYRTITNEEKYANKSPVEWAETFLHSIAKEPWTTHDQRTVYVKQHRRIRELKAGHAIVGPLFASNNRGSLNKISSLELGPNNFKAAVWAIRQVQDERQKNQGEPRKDYCDTVRLQDEAVQEFVRKQEAIVAQWKQANREIENNEGTQMEDQLEETFILMCKEEARWIREQIGANVEARERREKELMEEWVEKREEEWKEMMAQEGDEERDESIQSEEDWEDMEIKEEERRQGEESEEKKLEEYEEKGRKHQEAESQDHTQDMELEYQREGTEETQTSQASTSIGYDTRLRTEEPEAQTQESESNYGSAPDPMDFITGFEDEVMNEIEDYSEGVTHEWQVAAYDIADGVIKELNRRKEVDSYFKRAISDSIRGIKRKMGDENTSAIDPSPSVRKIRTLPEKATHKKRIVEKLVKGLMSSKWSSQGEIERQGEEKKKKEKENQERWKKEMEEGVREKGRKAEAERRKKAEDRKVEEQERKMKALVPPGASPKEGGEDMRKWMLAIASKIAEQDQKIVELEDCIARLRMTVEEKGKGRGGTGRPAQENREEKSGTPPWFPRPPPQTGPGGPAPKTDQVQQRKSYAAAAAPLTGPRAERPAMPPLQYPAPTPPMNEGERQRIKLAEKRDEEAKFKLEVALPAGMEAQEFIKKETLETVAKVLGVPASQIRSIRQVGSKNIIEITCRTVAARQSVLNKGKEVMVGKGEARITATENWTGMVVGGIWKGAERSEEEGGWKCFREGFEKENGVQLTKDPRWLTRKEHHTEGYQQSVVIHVAKTSDRNRLLANTRVEGQAKRVRLFESARDKARKQCTKCCEYGHMWYECSKEARCGKCGKTGHTSWTHKCADKKCTGNRNRVACDHDTKKCCNCGGDHGAMEQHCPARNEAFIKAIEKTAAPLNTTSGCN